MENDIPVLVLDDDPIVLNSLSEYLRMENYRVRATETLDEAMRQLEQESFRCVLTDVRLPEGSGFDLLQHVKSLNLSTAVIMLTGYGTIDDAVRAIKLGAFDYVTKPIADEEIKLAIERALQQQELVEENKRLREQLNMSYHLDNFICADSKMKRVLDMIDVVAGTDATVLMTGESGTGKTLAARAIHMNSRRSGKPFIELSCGSLTETLLESELFGHVKGAFSGAIADKRGRFEAADKGTLFLDEISLSSPSLQTKMLRVLESLKFEPVGSTRTKEVDVRLILATNEDLGALVKKGEFREDLYYRVNVMNIYLPPLRDRRDDIVPLARHFIEKYRDEAPHDVQGLSDDAIRVLTRYEWPGNVRELENVIHRAVLLCGNSCICAEDLEMQNMGGPEAALPDGEVLPLKDAMKRVERKLILEGLEATDGNRKEAAKRLGINRTTLYNKMHEYDLMDA